MFEIATECTGLTLVAAQRDQRVDACGAARFALAAREPVMAQSALWSAQSQRRPQRRCETPSAQSTRRIFQKILCDLRALCVEIRLRGLRFPPRALAPRASEKQESSRT